MKETLTGNYYHKKTWFGMVLMVEVNYDASVNNGGYITIENFTEYKKATEKHLAVLRKMGVFSFPYGNYESINELPPLDKEFRRKETVSGKQDLEESLSAKSSESKEQEMEEFFLEVLKNTEQIKNEKYPDSIFFVKGDYVFFEQDNKTMYFWCSYVSVW
jgi:hypothetical protein